MICDDSEVDESALLSIMGLYSRLVLLVMAGWRINHPKAKPENAIRRFLAFYWLERRAIATTVQHAPKNRYQVGTYVVIGSLKHSHMYERDRLICPLIYVRVCRALSTFSFFCLLFQLDK